MNKKVDDLEVAEDADEGVLETDTGDGEEGSRVESASHISYEDWVASGKDPNDYKGANVFNQIGDLMKRVEQMDRAIGRYKAGEAKVEKAIKKLAEHTTKQVQAEREKVIRELKAEKKQAMRDEDFDKVVDIDDKIAEVKKQADEDVSQVEDRADAAQARNEEIVEACAQWTKDPENKWYKTNPSTDEERELKEEADYAFEKALAQGRSPQEALAEAARRAKRAFPQYFKRQVVKGKVGESGDDNRAGTIKGSTKGKMNIKTIDPLYQKMAKEMSAMNPKKFPTPQSYVDAMYESGVFSE